MALAPGWPGTAMPYSVSVPITRRTLIKESLCWPAPHTSRRHAPRPGGSPGARCAGTSQVLAGVRHGVDGPARLGALLAGHQGADVDDALALLPGDTRPVIRVRGVGQVLVLAELVHARGEQVRHPQPL